MQKQRASAYPVVDPGTLRHRIEIQKQSAKQGKTGELIKEWVGIARAWASIEEITAKEFVQSGQVSTQVTHIITILWCKANIDATMQVAFGSQVYKIQSATNVKQMNVLIEMMCLAVNPGTVPEMVGL